MIAWTLLRAGAVPAVAVGVAVAVAAVFVSPQAVAGALTGTALTVAAFAAGPLLLRAARNVEPVMMLALALTTYLMVIFVLAVAYAVLSEVSWLAPPWVGGTILACSAAWLAGQTRTTARLRLLTFGDRVTPS